MPRRGVLCFGLGIAAMGCGAAEAVGPERGATADPGEATAKRPGSPAPDGEAPSEDVQAPAGSPVAVIAPEPVGPQLYSVGYVTWIWPGPAKTGTYLGYVRTGTTVPLKREVATEKPEPVPGLGCPGGFYAVEPRGYVCRDRTVSWEPDPSFLDAAKASAAGPGPFPYRYAISNGAPMYNRIPTAREQARFEKMYGTAGEYEPLSPGLRSHEELAVDEPIEPDGGPVPPPYDTGEAARKGPYDLVRQTIPRGSMLSFTRAFEAEGRTWLLSADHTLVPADRVRPFAPSRFRGVKLGDDVKLPIAWIREADRDRYRVDVSGEVVKAPGRWTVRSMLRLTGEEVTVGDDRYLETQTSHEGEPLYVAAADATVVRREPKIPVGVRPGQKWMIVRVTEGTFVAYEGLTPVYATLASPGSGGVSVRGRDDVKYSTTPRGTFYVTFKERAATMSPEKGLNRSFWIQDVPHTMYFSPPFAIHGAYWHERFGEYVSAGCINLSPLDAEAMFEWADPVVPKGWQGATGAGAKQNGETTAVVVRR